MSYNFSLCIKFLLSCLLYIPCEAAVGNILCTASNSSSCELYGNAVCDTTTCRCKDNYYDGGTTCQQKLQPGATCTQINQPTECVAYAVCKSEGSGPKCYCDTGLYNDNFATSGGQCVAELESEVTCTQANQPTECVPNAVCTNEGLGLKCYCNTGFYDNNFSTTGGQCVAERQLGTLCTKNNQPTECVPNAVCKDTGSGLKCYCNTGFYDNNFSTTGGQCVAEVKLDATCTQANQPTECVPNAMCKNDGLGLKCKCDTGFYDDNFSTTGGQCVAEIQSDSTCTKVNDATECVPNAVCKNGGSGLKCICNTGFYDDNFDATGGQCEAEIALGATCTVSGSADECVPNSTCTSVGSDLKCQCSTGYYDNDVDTSAGTCVPELQSGVTCTWENDATECVPNAVCIKKGSGLKCYCKTGFYDDNFDHVGGQCVAELESGVTCTRENDATECVPNAVCKNGGSGLKCTCNTDYYDDNFSASGWQCVAEKELGVTCSQDNQPTECVPNAVCKNEGSGPKCYCNTGFYDDNFATNGGQCIPEKESGVTCTQTNQPTECVPNAVCKNEGSGLKCYCNTGFYDNNFATDGGQCVSELNSGVTCTQNNVPTECIPNAVCKSDGDTGLKCTCNSGYYDSNFAVEKGSCVQELQSGVTCTQNNQPTECVPNAVCEHKGAGLKCYCTNDYYDNNGNNGGGTCSAKLQPGATCTQINQPTECVAYAVCKNEGSGPKCYCNTGFYDNNFAASGEQCVAELESEMTCTQANQPTECVPKAVCKDTGSGLKCYCNTGFYDDNFSTTGGQCVAGPAVPSAIITSDILGPSITVSWTVGGIIQHLSGTINGTSVTPRTFNITNILPLQTPQQQFNNVKNGERYVITVKAYSNGFTSAEFIDTIRTTSTQPNSPVIDTCDNQDLFETYMNLRWREPQVPNGDISHYIIYMSSTEVRTINTDSSTEIQRIENLLPKRQYCFQMGTVNDAVLPQNNKSSRSSMVCCFTRAGVAGLPQNVILVEVKSRSIKLSWMKPNDIKGVLNGYRVSLRVEGVCKVEVVYQCTDCVGAQTILPKTCDVQKKVNINSVDANSKVVTTIDGLFPYISYDVWIAAVNENGYGERNKTLVTTDSEVPEIPRTVVTTVQSPTVIQVRWTKPRVKPGNTTYRIKTYEVLGGTYTYVKDITVNGYDIETVDISGLEEYWDYTFTVTASTIKGSVISPMTTVVKTNQAPPGKVTNFEIMTPANVFTTMQVSWAIPLLRERNSIIKEYIIKHNISGVTIVETIPAESEMLQKFYYITPDKYYKVELYAANILNQHGEKIQKIYFASSKSKTQLSDTGYSIGTVVGAAVGCVLCSVLVLVLIFWLFLRHRKNKTSKPSRSRHEREESKIGDQYEDLGTDNVSSYQELGAKDSPNVYDQIGRVHTVDKHYENMLP